MNILLVVHSDLTSSSTRDPSFGEHAIPDYSPQIVSQTTQQRHRNGEYMNENDNFATQSLFGGVCTWVTRWCALAWREACTIPTPTLVWRCSSCDRLVYLALHRVVGLFTRVSFHDSCSNEALTLSLPSSISTFSQPFKKKCTSEVVRIGSIIIFHLSKQ